jgi:penicillin-binding protein 1A
MAKRPTASKSQRKTTTRRGTPWWKRVGQFFGFVIMFGLLGAVAAVGGAVYFFHSITRDMPQPDSIVDYTPGGVTEIYATDKDPKTGKNVLLGKVYEQYKTFVPVSNIPKVLRRATIAIEDERFETHTGVDFYGIARAIYQNVRGKNMTQGASTLTQQLVRSVYLPQEGGYNRAKTFQRKIQEMLLAMQLERFYTKDQILEMYLNEVYYGSNAYGVHAAAEVYFGKKLKNLTIAEAALIAGVPQRPGSLSPFVNKEAAKKRRNLVIGKMEELGYITPDEAKKARESEIKLAKKRTHTELTFKAPYFTHYVIQQMVGKFGRKKVLNGGLKIYTTLNWKMQREAESALINGVKSAARSNVTDGALVSVEPRTGYIRALVGGMDFKKQQYNNVIQGRRQPGSSFKIFVYAAALESGRFDNQYSSVDNSRRTYGSYSPSGGGPSGYVSMRTAVTFSYNNAAVNTANRVGIRNVVATARKMGVKSYLPTNELAIALGAREVTPLEMASAYGVIAAHGSYAEPMTVIRVVGQDGVTLLQNGPKVDKAVIPESVVANMSDMFAGVVAEGTASKAAGIHEVPHAHGKTGTYQREQRCLVCRLHAGVVHGGLGLQCRSNFCERAWW